MFAAEIRRKRVQRMRSYTHWRWHLDEVFVRINGKQKYFWRAPLPTARACHAPVPEDGNTPEIRLGLRLGP